MKMKIRNTKIRTQLFWGFAIILSFVLVIGVVAFRQTSQLHEQTYMMYNHPLQVRRALGALKSDILEMRLGVRDLMLAELDEEKNAALTLITIASINARNQFDVIKTSYLGPKENVNDAYLAFILWEEARQSNIQLALADGNNQIIKNSILNSGEVGALREDMLAKIDIIDQFAKAKGDELYLNSQNLFLELNRQLLILISTIIFLSLIVGYVLLKNIRKPLKIMNDAVSKFHQGDFYARSSYTSNNEFGLLSDSINQLAGLIQESNQLNNSSEQLSKVMLTVEDAREFFRSLLISLSNLTKAQMASVFLLDNASHNFERFDSIGYDVNSQKTFNVDALEGEFGQVITTKKIQHIKLANDDNRFIFNTTNGQYIPKETITIPLSAANKVHAIISLTSVEGFSKHSIELIERVVDTISARIEGVLAYQAIKEYRDVLEQQNQELDLQKNELVTQKLELSQQNVELEIQKNQITEASRLKTNFLSNMSHELRTPLNSVIALSGILNRRLEHLIPQEEYSYLEIIERNGKNLLELINDILDISRIESGFVEIELTHFDLGVLVKEVVELINPLAKQKNVSLVNQNKINEYFITSDMSKCRHILQNIIGNAVKFTEEGKVEVKLELDDMHVSIHVIDEGIGISSENIKHIFDEFRQADASTSRKYGGSGLGLAIANKYVTMLGGKISVNSIVNQGSDFNIVLPLKLILDGKYEVLSTNTNSVVYPDYTNSINKFTRKHILMVEDSDSAVIQIKDLLNETGHSVLAARDAFEAFDLIEKQIPDAIILDLMMPGLDGFEVLKTIRNAERTAHVPVLILTAKHITKEDLKLLKRNNVHQLIQKGDVNRIELQTAVHSMLFPILNESQKVNEKIIFNGNAKILIVEDNLDNLITTKALLDKKYTVIEANNGVEAIELASKFKPDLILMDISLPQLDGIEAFKNIRKTNHTSAIPVIALTASAMAHDKVSILAHGFNGFIAKPIIETDFFAVINEVLYGSE